MSAPQVTQAMVEAAIASEVYFTAFDGIIGSRIGVGASNQQGGIEHTLLTFCVLALKNGHTVAGEAYCADPAKFNAETGRIEARKAAISKLWPMVVYAERERMAAPSASATAAIARQFIDENRVSCPEATTNDRVYEHAPELVEKLAEVVGYYRDPEDDEVNP